MTEQPDRIDPTTEPTRAEVNERGTDWRDFLERSRRYFKLTRSLKRPQYARGLDRTPDEFY